VSFFDKLFGGKPKVVSDPDKVPDVFKQLSPILDEIGSEAINGTPENWTNAILTITCDGRRIDYSLKNQLSEEGTATISPRLAQLAEQLYTTMASHGDRWTKAELQFDQDGESWNVKSNFSYG
jgi:hypothetical protein